MNKLMSSDSLLIKTLILTSFVLELGDTILCPFSEACSVEEVSEAIPWQIFSFFDHILRAWIFFERILV